MPEKRYTRLTEIEREEISRGIAQKKSIRQIAWEIGRSPSTVLREIKRNSGKTGYRAFSANRQSLKTASSMRSGKSKLTKNQRLRDYVLGKLQEDWSPQEISGRIKMDYPLDMEMRISHEAIYQYIYVLPRGELKQTLIKALRQEHKYRRSQKKGKKKKPEERSPICCQSKSGQQRWLIAVFLDIGKVT
jgi:IS30 family transposase